MTSHSSPYEIDLASARQLGSQTWSFTLSPGLWDSINLPQQLHWRRVFFDATPPSQIPQDQIGVYAFVLEPDVANLKLAYLLYVGMTTDSFRARYGKYKSDQHAERPRRHLVKQMLTSWPDRLAFYYAAVDDRSIVSGIEDELIAAFKPPACKRYPAKVREPFKILDDGQ